MREQPWSGDCHYYSVCSWDQIRREAARVIARHTHMWFTNNSAAPLLDKYLSDRHEERFWSLAKGARRAWAWWLRGESLGQEQVPRKNLPTLVCTQLWSNCDSRGPVLAAFGLTSDSSSVNIALYCVIISNRCTRLTSITFARCA